MNNQNQQRLAFLIITLLSLLAIIAMLIPLSYILYEGLPAINLEFLTTSPSKGGKEGGIFTPMFGTIYLTILTLLIALPLGIAGGIYLAEFSSDNLLTKIVRISIYNLANLPSIVYGIFGLSLFVNGLRLGQSLLSGALTLSLLSLPIIVKATEEGLKKVPKDLIEGSYALGASKLQTLSKISLPFSMPITISGVMLAIGRIMGETAPIIFTVAVFFLPKLPVSPLDESMILSYHLFITATQIPDIRREMVLGTALVLMILTLLFFLGALFIKRKFSKT